MAIVRPGVTEVVISDEESGQSVTLRGGDEVPEWALLVSSNPRLFDIDGDGEPYGGDPSMFIPILEDEEY